MQLLQTGKGQAYIRQTQCFLHNKRHIYFSFDKTNCRSLSSRRVFPLTSVKALSNRGGINEESAAKGAMDVWVELVQWEFGLRIGILNKL